MKPMSDAEIIKKLDEAQKNKQPDEFAGVKSLLDHPGIAKITIPNLQPHWMQEKFHTFNDPSMKATVLPWSDGDFLGTPDNQIKSKVRVAPTNDELFTKLEFDAPKVELKVWLIWCSDEHGCENIQKVVDTERKAIDFIEFKPQMTGEYWGYFEKEVE